MKLRSHPAAALAAIFLSGGGAIAATIYAQATSSQLNGWEALVIVVNAILGMILMYMKYHDQKIADVRHTESQAVAVESAHKLASVEKISQVTHDLANSRFAAMEAIVAGLRDDLREARAQINRQEGANEAARHQAP